MPEANHCCGTTCDKSKLAREIEQALTEAFIAGQYAELNTKPEVTVDLYMKRLGLWKS